MRPGLSANANANRPKGALDDGTSHWQIIFGLVIGGMVAAPISIYLSNRIPVKGGLILVGSLVILVSLKTLFKAFF